jgi:hypothetical protein
MIAIKEDESDDTKNGAYQDLEHVFGQFFVYHIKIFAKVGTENVFEVSI